MLGGAEVPVCCACRLAEGTGTDTALLAAPKLRLGPPSLEDAISGSPPPKEGSSWMPGAKLGSWGGGPAGESRRGAAAGASLWHFVSGGSDPRLEACYLTALT